MKRPLTRLEKQSSAVYVGYIYAFYSEEKASSFLRGVARLQMENPGKVIFLIHHEWTRGKNRQCKGWEAFSADESETIPSFLYSYCFIGDRCVKGSYV